MMVVTVTNETMESQGDFEDDDDEASIEKTQRLSLGATSENS